MFQAVDVAAETGFQSTPSAWRETIIARNEDFVNIFQSTPSAWRETTITLASCVVIFISIHSLRMEGDLHFLLQQSAIIAISIHSLRMEGDGLVTNDRRRTAYFNPLPPHGGRLADYETQLDKIVKISIHSLRMEGDRIICRRKYSCAISIHSLRMEGDQSIIEALSPLGEFQSTPSAWRETTRIRRRMIQNKHFNPLPPHGGRLLKCDFF